VAGSVHLARVNVRVPVLCTSVVLHLISDGISPPTGFTWNLTPNQNFAGLYASTGKLIAATADQSSAWGAQGVLPMALAGGPYQLPAGFYWVAAVANTTVASQFGNSATPSFLAAGGGNHGLAPASARGAIAATGQTSLPPSITPSSNALTGATIWAALS
jgi:hypothetical protein